MIVCLFIVNIKMMMIIKVDIVMILSCEIKNKLKILYRIIFSFKFILKK